MGTSTPPKRKLKNGQPAVEESELRRLFLLNPGNWKFVTGTSPHVAGVWNHNCVVVPSLLALIAASLVLMMLLLNARSLWVQIASTDATEAQAEIVSRRWSEGSKSSSNWVTYRFRVETPDRGLVTYTKEQSVSRGTYEALPEGSTVKVSYVRTNPDISELAGTNQYQNGMVMPFILFLFAFVPAVVWIGYIARLRYLERSGCLLEGRVIECHCGHGRSASTVYLEYTFETPDGRQLFKSARRIDWLSSLAARPLPATGRPMLVLYAGNWNCLVM